MKALEENIEQLLRLLGLDINNPQLKDTPKRICKMYTKELFSGLYTEEPKITVFPNTKEYDEMIYLGNIQVKSMCSHHFMPFIGTAHIAYIPKEMICGISKLSRIVRWFMRRPQIQEELTKQIADYIMKKLDPIGVAVYIEATHMCMTMRGVEEYNSIMKTSDLRGVFRKIEAREEFFNMVRIR